MAAVILRRRANEGSAATEDIVDDRPLYLKEFPAETSISKNLKLGVLLGRFGKLKINIIQQYSCFIAFLHVLSLFWIRF
jgi:hypothetical protein